MIAEKYPSVNPVEAGKIVKEAFPFVKRQNYNTKKCSQHYYYNIREKISNTVDDHNDNSEFILSFTCNPTLIAKK
jgi:hypothetical protein